MKLKKDKFKIDDVAFKRNKGFTLRQEDLEPLLQGTEAENAFIYNLKAIAYMEVQDLRSAIILSKKALKLCGDDLGTYIHCQSTLDSIASSLITLARLDLTNLEVGWVYENLKELNCLGMEHHLLALRHYRAVGNFQKARCLVELLRSLYPNHPYIQLDRNQKKSNSRRKVSYEKNTDKEKNTAA